MRDTSPLLDRGNPEWMLEIVDDPLNKTLKTALIRNGCQLQR